MQFGLEVEGFLSFSWHHPLISSCSPCLAILFSCYFHCPSYPHVYSSYRRFLETFFKSYLFKPVRFHLLLLAKYKREKMVGKKNLLLCNFYILRLSCYRFQKSINFLFFACGLKTKLCYKIFVLNNVLVQFCCPLENDNSKVIILPCSRVFLFPVWCNFDCLWLDLQKSTCLNKNDGKWEPVDGALNSLPKTL